MNETDESAGAIPAALLWLRGALDCKEFAWDADQREAAEQAYSAAVAANPPAVPDEWLAKKFEVMHARGDAWVTTVAAAALCRGGRPLDWRTRECAAFMKWAVNEFPNPNGERFSYVGERPPNKFGWLWEYNCGVVQAAWAAWMERASPDN